MAKTYTPQRCATPVSSHKPFRMIRPDFYRSVGILKGPWTSKEIMGALSGWCPGELKQVLM